MSLPIQSVCEDLWLMGLSSLFCAYIHQSCRYVTLPSHLNLIGVCGSLVEKDGVSL